MTALTQKHKEQYQKYSQLKLNTALLNNALLEAIEDGHVDIVHYLLSSSELTTHASIDVISNEAFNAACKHGRLNVVEYLIKLPHFAQSSETDIVINNGFHWACKDGHIPVVRYLLSPELGGRIDINGGGDYPLKLTTISGHDDIVHYLLSSPEIMKHADIHAENDICFVLACDKHHVDLAESLLSYSGDQYIDFQQTQYNLDWAIKHHYSTTIEAMMLSLKRNDYMQYIDCLPKVEEYCLLTGQEEIYEAIVAHDVTDNDVIIDESFVMV